MLLADRKELQTAQLVLKQKDLEVACLAETVNQLKEQSKETHTLQSRLSTVDQQNHNAQAVIGEMKAEAASLITTNRHLQVRIDLLSTNMWINCQGDGNTKVK